MTNFVVLTNLFLQCIEAVHFNNIVNISITGLLPNTTYTCCVLAVTSYGESEPVCQNITIVTTNPTG